MGWMPRPPPGFPRSSSRAAPCATRRSSPPPTSTDWRWSLPGGGCSGIESGLIFMSAGSAPRFRFAPSPTGQLHVGNARTAILNWLLARHHGGAFVLRIEDTDVERNVADAETAILEDLRWLGMDWDEGPEVGGPYGPYRQSERVEEHRAAAEALLRSGNAYVCTCPPAPETGAERRERCPCADRGDIEWRPGTSVRFRVPDREVRVVDQVRGEVVFPAGSIEDFVLLRGNGRATY